VWLWVFEVSLLGEFADFCFLGFCLLFVCGVRGFVFSRMLVLMDVGGDMFGVSWLCERNKFGVYQSS
jgi:hypothetical protein